VLADAFVNGTIPDDWMQTSPETVAALQQIRENALAVVAAMREVEPGKNHYQGIFAELHRRFRVSSYKNVHQNQYQAVLDFLDAWAAATQPKGRGG
jgi:hypothetical protein